MRMNVQRGYHRKRRRSKFLKWKLIEYLFILLFFVSASLVVNTVLNRIETKKEEDSASQDFVSLDSETSAEFNLAEPNESQQTSMQPQMFTKASSLLEVNRDLVGMVGFGDVSLYVCQYTDNVYYASHRFDGSEDPAGMIYMDYRCNPWPLGDNTILYGHNMRDGSRFGKLNRFTKDSFISENPRIRYATMYDMHDYIPISVFYTSTNINDPDYFDFAQSTFASEVEFTTYINEVKERSIIQLPTSAQYGDSLLTMATCSGDEVGGRLVVVGVAAK